MSRKASQLRVAVLWHDTVVAETTVGGKSVTIGENPKNTLMIPDVANVGDSYELFSADKGGGYSLNLADGMSGQVSIKDEEFSAEDALKQKGRSISIDGKDWGVIDMGPLAVFFQFVDDRAIVPATPIWGSLETSVLSSILVALTVHFGVLIAAFMLYEDKPQFTDLDLDDRFMKVIVEEPPPEIEEEEEEESVDEDVGKKAGGEEGKFGEEDKKDKSKVPKRDGEMVDKIKDVGIHKALGSNLLGRGPLKNVFGDKTGFDSKLNAAMSGTGDSLVVGHGAGGMGLRGTGSGGGGEGFGRIHGMGRIDTGGGRGTRAKLRGRGKKKRKVRMRASGGNVSGFCKKKDIQRVVSARSRGVKYCYEKELSRNPELNGKVNVTWRIGLDGKVVKVVIAGSTLGNKSVEGCIKRQIKRWRFPKPEGGMCQIKYPFVFSAGL